jgi:hypothetical protein
MRISDQLALGGRIVARGLALALTLLSATASLGDTIGSPRLLAAEIAHDSGSVQIEGQDPAAPRALVLWIVRDRGPQELARTRSRADGGFDFGQVVVPPSGLALAVRPVGRKPGNSDLWIEGRLRAPRIRAPMGGVHPFEIEILPRSAEGEIRIHEADTGVLRLRRPIGSLRGRGVVIDLAEELGPGLPRAVRIEQVDGAGRRSSAVEWPLAPLPD